MSGWVEVRPGGEDECRSLMAAGEIAMEAALGLAADQETPDARVDAHLLHAAGFKLRLRVDRLIQYGAWDATLILSRAHAERLADWAERPDYRGAWARDTRRVLAAALAPAPATAGTATAPEAVA
jgi:hypothetical protein